MSVVDIGIHDVKSVKASKIKRLKSGSYTMDLIVTHADFEGNKIETELTLFSDNKKNLKVV